MQNEADVSTEHVNTSIHTFLSDQHACEIFAYKPYSSLIQNKKVITPIIRVLLSSSTLYKLQSMYYRV